MATYIGKRYNQCVLFTVGSHIIYKVYAKINKYVFVQVYILNFFGVLQHFRRNYSCFRGLFAEKSGLKYT